MTRVAGNLFDAIEALEIGARQPPEDYELWSRISRHYRVANLPERLTVYREVPSSMSRDGLQPFVIQARKVSTGAAGRRRQRTAGSRQETASIRSWAKDQGIQVNERGRIPASVVREYEAAH